MNKYYFVNIGAEVIWHPVNSDEKKVMQVCTSAPHPVENDTLVSLIFFHKNRHKAQRKAKFYINKCRSASCMQGGLKQASA